jgi:hypothetical protein
MSQSLFKPRILLLATALAAGAAVAQTTYTTPSAATTPQTGTAINSNVSAGASTSPPSSSDSASLPAKNSDRPASLSADSVGTGADRLNYGTPNNAPTTGSTAALDRAGSANAGTTATKSSTNAAPVARTHSNESIRASTHSKSDSTQMSTSSSATNPTGANAETRATYRAMLRDCVQLSGAERDSCIDRAVVSHPQS